MRTGNSSTEFNFITKDSSFSIFSCQINNSFVKYFVLQNDAVRCVVFRHILTAVA